MASEIVVTKLKPAGLMSVIESLVSNPNVDMDKLKSILEMQERFEANHARNAFNVAFSEFKAEAVQIVKNVVVKDGPLKGKNYVDKFGVVNAITPALSKHGLSHSWKLTKDTPDWLEVTCTLRHVLGHFEQVSMGAGPDTGPGRNAIQARSSSNSYLERITLLAVTGMAASDDDDDGNGGNSTDIVVDDLLKAANMGALKNMFGTAYKNSAKRPEAQQAFKAAYETRKAELEAAQ